MWSRGSWTCFPDTVDEARHALIADVADERLDKFIARSLDVSRSRIATLIRGGQVLVNGSQSRPSYRVSLDDQVVITVPATRSTSIVFQALDLDIVHEDDDIIVVNKPAGLVVHPGRGNPDGTLCNGLLDRMDGLPGHPERPGIVHRLDKGTSGVMVVVKNQAAMRHLAAQFAAHTAERSYLAMVWGQVKADSGTIDEPLGRHPKDRVRFTVRPRGKRAVTHWEVLSRVSFKVTSGRGHMSLIRCRLETGRTHQVRVHLSHLGHPVVGDTVYMRPHYRPRNHLADPLRSVLAKLDHQLLHAVKLGLNHPITGERLCWKRSPPADFQAVLDCVGIVLEDD